MIGVVTAFGDMAVVREFFELFKTPWEVYESGRPYDVVLCAGEFNVPHHTAEVVVVYSGSEVPCQSASEAFSLPEKRNGRMLSYGTASIPIYGKCVSFPNKGSDLLTDQDSGRPAGYIDSSGGTVVARIGYDLFAEVRFLLEEGQSIANAGIPTLELHIAVLRDVIVENGISLVEIPPVPAGYRFIACLTHDVDHPSIRRHRFDHTALGFLYRAILKSVLDAARGRVSVRQLFENWAAAFKLPFIHLGIAKDFWGNFGNVYRALEMDARSTFFVIPWKDCAGISHDGPAPSYRAARYSAEEIADTLHVLMAAGCEIGLHGIDAWHDPIQARRELDEIRRLTGRREIGVRMHWLYYDHHSAAALETAGVSYDSSVGYNDTVGYAAGTTQAYKPFQASRLLELPLHIMDTALFYPGRLGIRCDQAMPLLNPMIDNAVRFGGCLTINWHDRSVAPERLWSQTYSDILHELESQGAWFATGAQAVSWFRKRRDASFGAGTDSFDRVRGRVEDELTAGLPLLRLRTHAVHGNRTGGPHPTAEYVDVTVAETPALSISCGPKV
jgi:hypothetical protein